MKKENDKIKNPDIIEESKDVDEISDLPLEKMDFEVVKKVLADLVSDSELIGDEYTDPDHDDLFLELIVPDLETGLKKAVKLLGVTLKELKYKMLDTVIKPEDGRDVTYHKIEFRKKLITGKPEIAVSDDKLTAHFKIVFPKLDNDIPATYERLMQVILGENIKFGIDKKGIKNAIEKLKENYDALQNIVFAAGKPPGIGKNCEVINTIFSSVENVYYKEQHDKYLGEILSYNSLERISDEHFPVFCVNKGDLIASTTEPGKGLPGTDVFGQEIPAEDGHFAFQAGKNVEIKLENNQVNYYAQITGYLELEDDFLAVHSPVWVSENYMEAYFILFPLNGGDLLGLDDYQVYKQLKNREIGIGVDTDTIDKLIKSLSKTGKSFDKVRIARGVEAVKGENAVIELFYDDDTRPGKILEDGRIDYRELDIIKTVGKNQLIALRTPPKKGVDGKNLKGEVIPAEMGDEKQLNALNNVRVEQKDNDTIYYSTIEGRVVLVGESGISVNQVYEITGNVDFKTGNINFNGDVQIKGSVVSGFKVKAEGDITIKGTVNQDVELISNGNISVKQGILGREMNTRLVARGSIIAQFAQSIHMESGADIVIRDYVMNSNLRAKGRIISPDPETKTKGKGSLFGGELIALKGINTNSLGSDYAKMTKVIVGIDFEYEKTVKNINKGMQFCDNEIAKISKFLKLGFQDIETVKKRIAKLPKDKQKPFIDAFRKLGEVTRIKKDILSKKENYFAQNEELARKAEITVRKELFPRVNIQIGEAKMLTTDLASSVRLKESKNRKNIVVSKL